MKRIFLALMVFCVATSLASAQESATTAASEETVTLKGVIIDNMCAGVQKPEDLDSFVKTHTKQCALMPLCAASGYSIYTDGQLIKLDKESNVKIEEFLNQEGSDLNVDVTGRMAGEELSLVAIENQK